MLIAAAVALAMALFPALAAAADFDGALDGGPFAALSPVEGDPLDSLSEIEGDPFASLSPTEDAVLDASRGRAVLPDGLTVEATVLMRVLVDGQELAQSVVPDAAAFAPDPSTFFNFAETPSVFQNTLNGISLEQYREINFRISNIPIVLEAPRFIPPPVITTDVLP